MTGSRIRAAHLVLLVPLLAIVCQPAPARGEDRTPLLDVLRALRVDSVPADYVILLDTSASMQSGALYDRAVTALRPLVAAFTPVDRLTLISFAATPTVHFSGAVADGGSAALDRLPAQATGSATDIGAAIAAAVDGLDRPGVSDPATVILLTDGAHQPLPSSVYFGLDSPAWTELTGSARAVASRRPVKAYGIPLAPETGVELLDRVVPHTTVMDLPPDQLGEFLVRVKDRAGVDKAAGLVRQDRIGVEVTLPQGVPTVTASATPITVRLTSTAQRVPLTVTGMRATAAGVSVVDQPDPVTLAPGESKTVTVAVRGRPAGGWSLGRRESARTAHLVLTGTVTSEWAGVIRDDLGLAFEPEPVRTQWTTRVVTTSGIPYYVPLLALVLLVGAAAAVHRRLARRWVPMSGRLIVSEPGRSGQHCVALQGRRVVYAPDRITPADDTAPRLAGRGVVRARRVPKLLGSGSELELHITYANDGRSGSGRCRPRQTESIVGTTFVYHDS
jgi:hypothetical protein